MRLLDLTRVINPKDEIQITDNAKLRLFVNKDKFSDVAKYFFYEVLSIKAENNQLIVTLAQEE